MHGCAQVCEHVKKWGLTEEHEKEFIDVVSSRLMLMCRHVNQAACKKKKPAWYTQLFDATASDDVVEENVVVDLLEEGEDDQEEEAKGRGGGGGTGGSGIMCINSNGYHSCKSREPT